MKNAELRIVFEPTATRENFDGVELGAGVPAADEFVIAQGGVFGEAGVGDFKWAQHEPRGPELSVDFEQA